MHFPNLKEKEIVQSILLSFLFDLELVTQIR